MVALLISGKCCNVLCHFGSCFSFHEVNKHFILWMVVLLMLDPKLWFHFEVCIIESLTLGQNQFFMTFVWNIAHIDRKSVIIQFIGIYYKLIKIDLQSTHICAYSISLLTAVVNSMWHNHEDIHLRCRGEWAKLNLRVC